MLQSLSSFRKFRNGNAYAPSLKIFVEALYMVSLHKMHKVINSICKRQFSPLKAGTHLAIITITITFIRFNR